MDRHVLTLNAGSSSVKFGLFDIEREPTQIADGEVERIGDVPRLKITDASGETRADHALRGEGTAGHAGAINAILAEMDTHFPDRHIASVGHRVVHGGLDYSRPCLIDEKVIGDLTELSPFAPLHQPHNLAGIHAAREAFPGAPQIACFDTAFHHDHPWVNNVFALPQHYYDEGIRRYGFHGLSYEYIAGELKRIAPHLYAGRVVVTHLGNGASMCGLQNGRSIGSTMGFSALDGLPMGTRCGQLDPGVLLYLMDQKGMNADEIADLLYRKSGLLGLSGLTNDMRTLEAAGTKEARQAIDYYVFRIRRELGALCAVLGGLDAVVFCGGIGENSRMIRSRVLQDLGWLGIEIDHAKNTDNARVITTELSRARVMVIPTNEDMVIARAAAAHFSSR
ncbi:MAG: acetate/propionate family kinase [Stappiaceae bacterium]